jgi:hypothetical protein
MPGNPPTPVVSHAILTKDQADPDIIVAEAERIVTEALSVPKRP